MTDREALQLRDSIQEQISIVAELGTGQTLKRLHFVS